VKEESDGCVSANFGGWQHFNEVMIEEFDGSTLHHNLIDDGAIP
jgi:hypothetical protein